MNKFIASILFVCATITANAQDWDDRATVNPFKGEALYDSRTDVEIFESIQNGDEPSSHLRIKYPHFGVTIYNYGVYETVVNYNSDNRPVYIHSDLPNSTVDIKAFKVNNCFLIPLKDTVDLNEWVSNDLSNKMLQISPTGDSKDITYKVSAVLNERIWQQMPRNMGYEEWENKAQTWQGKSPAVELKDSAKYYFRIPQIDALNDFEVLRKRLNLRDTLSVIEGEYDDVATIVYRGRPSHFIIDDIILRIDRYQKETLIETKYIKIEFSYGC